MNTRCVFSLFALALAGCESAPPGGHPGPYVKPGLILVPADQAQLYGLRTGREEEILREPPPGYPVTDVRSVQTESPVTALQFNRYADPTRPGELMHEAHIVYRREAPPRWRLQPAAAGQQVLVGPALTDGRGEVKPLASQELDSYLSEHRANAQKQQQLMGQVSEGMRQLAEQQQQLAKELAKVRGDASPPVQRVTKEPSPLPASAAPEEHSHP